MFDAKQIKESASPAPVAMPDMVAIADGTFNSNAAMGSPLYSERQIRERDAQWQAHVDALTHDVGNGLTEIARQAQEIERLQAACAEEHQAFEALSHRFDVLHKEECKTAEYNAELQKDLGKAIEALRSAPTGKQPLTDEGIRLALTGSAKGYVTDTVRDIVRDVERAHGIVGTPDADGVTR